MGRVRRMSELPDIKVSLRDVIIAGVFVVGIVTAGAVGYFRLYGMAQAGQVAAESIPKIECYIRQLNNFMIDGRKPLPHEACEHAYIR